MLGRVAGRLPVRPDRRQVLDERGVVDGEDRCRRRAPSPWSPRRRRLSAHRAGRRARCGTSVPGSQTPSQTSPSGSCSRQSACHTTGVRRTASSARLAAELRNDHRVTRAADIGITIGILPSGPTASIVDVPGVGVGHATVWRDEPPPPAGRGVARTGVTVVDLGRQPVPQPGPGRRRGAQRRRRVHGLSGGRRVGAGRDPGLPDLDDAARAGCTTRRASC